MLTYARTLHQTAVNASTSLYRSTNFSLTNIAAVLAHNNRQNQRIMDRLQQQQQLFNGLCSGTTRVGRYRKKHSAFWAVLRSGWVSPPPVFWIFMEQGKIMEAEAPTVRVGATPTGLTAPPPTTSQGILQAGCPSCRPINSVKALKVKRQSVSEQRHNVPLDTIGHFGDDFYRPDDPTNSVQALKEASWPLR